MEDVAALKRSIKKFNFKRVRYGSQGFSRLLIQLFGYLGNGKSSFINTCKYVWDDGPFKNIAQSSSDDGGHTMVRISYPLTKKITLVDNRGCSSMNVHEAGEIFAQLGNLLPLDQRVEWSSGSRLEQRMKNAEPLVKASDFIFPIFVYSAKNRINRDEIKQYRELLSLVRDITGIFPIVVLTHKTLGDVAEQERIFRNIGVERIYAFENYTPENHIKTRGRDEDVLMFLLDVIKDVQFRVAQERNPMREMLQRKEIILDYIHRREKNQLRIDQEQAEREQENLRRHLINLKKKKPTTVAEAQEQRIKELELELEIQKLEIGSRTQNERRQYRRRRTVGEPGEQPTENEGEHLYETELNL
ncbi:uncharacterized protein RCH25_037987 [Pelodytes ibericus]